MLLVGHVTKQGSFAGPKVLEHAVDTVLYLEGERDTQFRIMRAVKNRFGSTDEIGIFEMGDTGLREVANPSALFLQERAAGEPGTVVVASVEGSRSLFVEVQALVAPAPFGGTPRGGKCPAWTISGPSSYWLCWSGGAAFRCIRTMCTSTP